MKKLFIFMAVLTLTLTLTGCGDDVKDLPDEMTMAELDEYLGRDDVQYVDLRNFDEKLTSGYIQGFESIPYFDYLKYQDILVDTNGDWVYDSGEIKSAATLRAMFNEDKTILLMCGSGTRAQYLMDALLSLGYTDVINIGGFEAYVTAEGEAVVLGGSAFNIDLDVKGDYVPGTYVGYDEDHGYFVTLTINAEGGIGSVVFDAVYDPSTKQALGTDYTLGSGSTWAEEADELAAAIVANQGWNDAWTIIAGATSEDHDNFDATDQDVIDDIAGVTISIEGFYTSWMEAIGLATE